MSRFFVLATGALLLVLLGMSLLADNGAFDLVRLKGQRDRLQEVNAALVRENARLLRQIDRLQNDPGFLETIARRELGMIGTEDRILKLSKGTSALRGSDPHGETP
jgi:cell division protein FtsB